MKREDIARVAHEVNRAYCEALGDFAHTSWENAPQWQRDSILNGVNLHMDTNSGPETSHKRWLEEKVAAGWKYGAEKDFQDRTHPCLVPFRELPTAQQAKDFIFRAVVLALG